MTKHFKSKRKLRHDLIIKYLLILVLSYIVIQLCLSLFLHIPLIDLNFKHNQINSYHKYISTNTINSPQKLLNYYYPVDKELAFTFKEKTNTNTTLPSVYIYNTHQKEAYKDKKTVLDAALRLKDVLTKYQVKTIVEEQDITEFMRVNNIDYAYSYYASKFFIKDALQKYQPDLLIDLHRDAVTKDKSTVTIEKKKYAKVLFVSGKENKNYKKNLEVMNSINKLIKDKYPTLTRGIISKSGKNVNGIYNQDLNSNIILIEVGGNQNTYEEVNNTLDVLGKIIGEYLYEKRKNF